MVSGPQNLVRSLDVISGVLGELSVESADTASGFYDALCSTICDQTSIRRAIIFLWDPMLRTVRAVGSHEVDISLFADDVVDVDLLPAARRALERDEVVRSTDHSAVAERYGNVVSDRTLIVAPMVAGRNWIGVVIGDQPPGTDALADDEQNLLWTLGKTTALAIAARSAARQAMRARELEGRIDLAREIHERVVQRLFGVSLALAGDGEIDRDTRQRCGDEIQAALHDLRDAVQRPLGRRAPATGTTLADEIARVRREHAELATWTVDGDAAIVPDELQPLTQSVLREAVRNLRKHARPTAITISLRETGRTIVLEVTNDGAGTEQGRSGMGLRLGMLEALQHGGLLEFGPEPGGLWRIRLTVPHD